MHRFLFRDDEGIVPYESLIGSRKYWGIVTGGHISAAALVRNDTEMRLRLWKRILQ